jgi:hypothetical protein
MPPATQAARITKARMGVILSAPFFGSLLMRLQMVPDSSVDTFCTNGKVIRYSDQFSASLSDSELRGVLVHEVCHCAQGHLWPMSQRDPRKWNGACDYAVNNMLEAFVREEKERFEKQHGGGRFVEPWALPKGGLIDPAFDGLCSEEIYARLPNGRDFAPSESQTSSPSTSAGQPETSNSKPGTFPTSPGAFEAPAEDPTSTTTSEQDWQIAVTQATAVALLPVSRARIPRPLGQH